LINRFGEDLVRKLTLLILLWHGVNAGSASAATIVVEDFEAGGMGAFDPQFKYEFASSTTPLATLVRRFQTEDFFLFLGRNTTATVTYPTLPGQYVRYASLQLSDSSGGGNPTFVEFIGLLGAAEFSAKNSHVLATVSTHGLNLGPIAEIRLRGSLESSFDNITLEVVPEPASISLFGFAILVAAARINRFRAAATR
jgi:hypothetical protein